MMSHHCFQALAVYQLESGEQEQEKKMLKVSSVLGFETLWSNYQSRNMK